VDAAAVAADADCGLVDAAAGGAVGVADGDVAGATDAAGADRIGVATGDAAPSTFVAKQIVSAIAHREWGYRIIGEDRIKSKSKGRAMARRRLGVLGNADSRSGLVETALVIYISKRRRDESRRRRMRNSGIYQAS
jgi:hypothetical protein